VQSRRDHLQAYQFATERLVRAVVTGRPGAGDTPLRRSGLGVSIGIVFAVLGCVAALVYGLIAPTPSTAWRQPGAIIVEKETGTRYLLLDGELHPTANYSSALLAAGQNSSVQFVSRAQLAGVPVGDTIGIPGAPDSVPTSSSLLPGSWALCARRDGGVVLDLAPAGHAAPGPENERVFVTSTAQSAAADFVVWDSVKYPVPQQAVLAALGLGDQQPNPVDPAWLAALPTGKAVEPPNVPGLGGAGPVVAGRQSPVGTVYSTTADGVEEDYLLLSDGLAPITRTEAALFELGGGVSVRQVTTAEVAAAHVSGNRSLLAALPDFLSGPVFSAGDASLCVSQSTPGSAAKSIVETERASVVAADPPVVVPAGSGMLVEPPGQGADTNDPIVYLIADTGERYRIDSTDALGALGFASVGRIEMPTSVLGLVSNGPVLDVGAAVQAAS
jgi:type VII secretion protein EccB